jgi:hypothetical protein
MPGAHPATRVHLHRSGDLAVFLFLLVLPHVRDAPNPCNNMPAGEEVVNNLTHRTAVFRGSGGLEQKRGSPVAPV